MSASLKFWRRNRVPKKESRDEAVAHSTTKQYRQLRRLGFLRLISSKITPAKEKEGERARSEDLKRKQEKRIKQWVAL